MFELANIVRITRVRIRIDYALVKSFPTTPSIDVLPYFFNRDSLPFLQRATFLRHAISPTSQQSQKSASVLWTKPFDKF